MLGEGGTGTAHPGSVGGTKHTEMGWFGRRRNAYYLFVEKGCNEEKKQMDGETKSDAAPTGPD
ncbi:MAG TPA: hypothetical protein PLJ50_12585, partial [Candidatus Latescibacteria bacterium]|nr:hypothetical protein [Candidatus Latescibacterota bacterium]